jgi:uncharacterized membrane protein
MTVRFKYQFRCVFCKELNSSFKNNQQICKKCRREKKWKKIDELKLPVKSADTVEISIVASAARYADVKDRGGKYESGINRDE